MRFSLVTAPTVEPLTLQEVKDFLRITTEDEDELLTGLIASAREAFEHLTGRQLLTATWDLHLDRFPQFSWEPLVIPKAPVQSVTSVTYVDGSGVSQTWSNTLYDVTTYSGPWAQPGILAPTPEEDYPDTRRVPNAVTVRFVAGYGGTLTDIPEDVRAGLKVLIAQSFEHREAVVVGQTVSEMPWGVRGIIGRFRIPVMA